MYSTMPLASSPYTQARWWGAVVAVVVLGLALWISSYRAQARGEARPSLGTRLLRVFAGTDGRVSTSKTVAFGWTAVVTFILLSLIFVEPESWDDALKNLSPTYLLLLAGPYASLVLAKAAVTSRISAGTLNKPTNEGAPRLGDLFNDDSGRTDIVDLQYVVFNVVAMVFVIVTFIRASQVTGFPSIPEGLVLLTGGPAALYLSNKVVPGTGPTILSVLPATVRVGETFTITGQGLTAEPAAAVQVGGTTLPAEAVKARTPTGIVAIAPNVEADLGKKVGVGVGTGAFLAEALTVLGRTPALYGLSTGTAKVADPVTARGDWSDEEAEALIIVLDENVAQSPEQAAAGTATFKVPQLVNVAVARDVDVKVRLGGEESAPVKLEIGP